MAMFNLLFRDNAAFSTKDKALSVSFTDLWKMYTDIQWGEN
jgi:hypothetical protein